MYTFISTQYNGTIIIIQVFRRLQKLQLCTSHMSLLNTLEIAAEGHDEQVFDWQYTLEQNTLSSQGAHVLR